MSSPLHKFGIAMHSGGGTILRSSLTAEKEKLCKDTLQVAFNSGYNVLQRGGRTQVYHYFGPDK